MSKFLKFIVALVLIAFIGGGAALIVPPLIGVDAVVVQEGTNSDMPVGTTVFAKQKPLDALTAGAKILTQDNNSVYIRKIKEVDTESGFAVTEDGQILYLSEQFKSALLKVPFLGYLMIATQTKQGLIILLLILAATIILFIISEVLRKAKKNDDDDYEDEEEYEDEEDDDAFYSRLADRKRRRDERRNEGIETIHETAAAERAAVSASFAEAAEEEPVAKEQAHFRDIFEEQATISLADEVTEDLGAVAEAVPEEASAGVTAAAEETSATGDTEETLPDVQAALEAALENQQLNRTENLQYTPEADAQAFEEEYAMPEIELAMPVFTPEELIQKAYAEGHDPTITTDEVTGVTLVDFSDCI